MKIPYPIYHANRKRRPCFAARHPFLTCAGIAVMLAVTAWLFAFGFSLILSAQ